MDKYMYLILGILLGIAIMAYFWADREEKIERKIKYDQKLFSTKKLDTAMENTVEIISQRINELKRELTEEEKDEIIARCCKEKFY